ncbi:MAG TPA: ATP-binding protein [Thermodesulfovibrionales bacterium]|nr:ATP-binding protein [Thermodesulfovibrionales bacterium]
MNGVVAFIRSRLGVRLLIYLLAGVILSFGILTYLVVRRENAILMEFNREGSSIIADTITKNLREAMIEKDPAIVKRMLSRHNSAEGVQAAVFRSDGSLAYGEIDYELPRDVIVSPQAASVKAKGSLVFLKPLLNEKECHACHGARDRIRGIVAIKISTERAEREAADTAKHIAVFAALTALLSGVGLIILIRKMISGPLQTLKNGTEKIREGDLAHRFDVHGGDEFGSLALAFDRMTETLENAHKHLEEAVQRKTLELRVVSELSAEVFRGDLTLEEILDRFLSAITDNLRYSFCTLCFIDKNTGLLSQEYSKNVGRFCASDIALTDNHPFVKALLGVKTTVIRAQDLDLSDYTGTVALIPVVSHIKHCREVNRCTYSDCPAFNRPAGHCWLMENTLCRSPHSLKGRAKIYGCTLCDAFPLIGILIAGREGEIGKSSIHSLEIMSSEIAAAIENYRLIDDKRKDITGLVRLHDLSVRNTQYLSMPELTASIVSSASLFTGADASILWLMTDNNILQYQDSFGLEVGLVPPFLGVVEGFVGRAIKESRPVETIAADEIQRLGALTEKHDFLYAAAIPLYGKDVVIGCLTLLKRHDMIMSESEKAIIALFASQAASSLTVAKTFGDLKNQKELSDAIFNCTLSGVAVLDREGAVININQAGMEILQLPKESVIGQRITDIYPETEDMLLFEGSIGREVTIKLKDGTASQIGFTNSALFDKGGTEKGIVIVFRDLTEIKELQSEVRRKHHFESMGKVVSGVAHEVRNPLFAIQAIAQILEREVEHEQHQALLGAILKETGRMKKMVDELLLYGKPLKLNIADLDLGALMGEMKDYYRAKKSDADLSIDVQPLTTVSADKDKLRQVFLNLLDNALGAGGSRISITSEKTDSVVKTSVKDDGAGISKDDLEKIFDPFFTTKKEGTGLGLSICKKIIEDHGGSIEIQSGAGEGTTVTLTLKAGRQSRKG